MSEQKGIRKLLSRRGGRVLPVAGRLCVHSGSAKNVINEDRQGSRGSKGACTATPPQLPALLENRKPTVLERTHFFIGSGTLQVPGRISSMNTVDNLVRRY